MSDTVADEAAEPAQPDAPAPEVESDDNRTARQKVLDHFADCESDQTVGQIIQGIGLNRNSCEQAIHRAVQSGQIDRTAPARTGSHRRSRLRRQSRNRSRRQSAVAPTRSG